MVEFVPFHFIVDLFGGVIVDAFGLKFSVSMVLTLTGPQPFVGNGLVTVDFLGKHEFPIHFEIGDPVEELAKLVVILLDELSKELSNPRCWSAALPPDASLPVSLRQLTTGEMGIMKDKILVYPHGELTVRENLLPLGISIERFGASVPSTPGPFEISQYYFGSGLVIKVSDEQHVRDSFARGQFLNLTEDQKISSPEFEAFRCGHSRIGTQDIVFGATQSTSFEYDVTIIDKKDEKISRTSKKDQINKVAISEESFSRFTQPGLGKQTAAQSMGSAKFAGTAQGIEVHETQYVIVSTDDLSRRDNKIYRTYTEADAACRSGGASGSCQVVELHEAQ
jgi:hypothetical protein